jgi:hypothetical protein
VRLCITKIGYSDVLTAGWNSPGRVGLSGDGIMVCWSTTNAGGRVGLRNGGSPFFSNF